MAKQKPTKTYDSALQYFRAHEYDVREALAVANQVEVRKHNCAAVLARTADGDVQYVAGPGCLIGGKIATLVDHGFQKFFVVGDLKIAATAERLCQLHDFQEETAFAAGHPDYYNLSLGTVSDVYLYDRVRGREPETEPATNAH